LIPTEKILSATQKTELLDHCETYMDEFFSACPALAVENASTAARTANSQRKPKISDGIDLMHGVIALAYCDHFLVRDGFVQDCAAHVIKALHPSALARIHDDPVKLANDLQPSVSTASGVANPAP
jgi:hypothetical protein